MKKKIFSLLMLLALVFVFVACGEVLNENEIKINFDTKGGSEITAIVISKDNVAAFTMPEDPTKENCKFDGWYLDSEYNTEFVSFDFTKNEYTLYAKWIEKTETEIKLEAYVGNWVPEGQSDVATALANIDKIMFAQFKENYTCFIPINPVDIYSGVFAFDEGNNIKLLLDGLMTGTKCEGKAEIKDGKLVLTIGANTYKFVKAPTYNFKPFTTVAFPSLKGIDTTLNFDGSINLAKLLGMDGNVKLTLKGALNVAVENLNVENIKDLKAALTFNGKLEIEFPEELKEDFDQESFDQTNKALSDISLYVTGGKAYLHYLETSALESTTVEGDSIGNTTIYRCDPVNVIIDLEKVVEQFGQMELPVVGDMPEEVLTIVQTILPSEFMHIENEKDLDNALNALVNDLLSKLAVLGIQEKTINGFVALLNEFLPTKTIAGNTVKYQITKAGLIKALTDTKKYLEENQDVVQLLAALVATDAAGSLEEAARELTATINGYIDTIIEFMNKNIEINELSVSYTLNGFTLGELATAIEATLKLDEGDISLFESVGVKINLNLDVNSLEPTITFPAFTDYVEDTESAMEVIMGILGDLFN